MKTMTRVFLLSVMILTSQGQASELSLEEQLGRLNLSGGVPAGVTQEKLYSVQPRANPLARKSEVSVGYAHNFTGDSFLSSRQTDLVYRYHLSDQWNLSATGSYVFNSFTDAADRLREIEGLVPDVAYAKYRVSLLAGYNAFYGKFRLGMDDVVYFDQYFEAGPGLVMLNTKTVPALNVGAGFAFWMGKNASLRVGIRDAILSEQRAKSSSLANHILGQIQVGYLLGGANR